MDSLNRGAGHGTTALRLAALQDKPDSPSRGARLQVSLRHALAIDAICAQIRLHPADDHTVPTLANRARLSVGRFARVFKQHVGVTPHRYVSCIRVLHARALLQGGATPLQAALASGFYDQSHLSRSIKAITNADAAEHPSSMRRPGLEPAADLSPFCSQASVVGGLAVHFHSLESLS